MVSPMRIAVISDTHGQMQPTRTAVQMLESLGVERVLHCGDIGSVEVVEMFAPWPTDFVLGNTDWDQASLAGAIKTTGNTFHGKVGELEIEGRQIILLHSDDQQKFTEVLESSSWDLVCYGHTHQAKIDQRGSMCVLNPGAIHRAYPPSFAIVELPSMEATIISLLA
jgi:putative phosphoesterase